VLLCAGARPVWAVGCKSDADIRRRQCLGPTENEKAVEETKTVEPEHSVQTVRRRRYQTSWSFGPGAIDKMNVQVHYTLGCRFTGCEGSTVPELQGTISL